MIDNAIDSIAFCYELITVDVKSKDWVKHLVPVDNILSIIDCETRAMYLEGDYKEFCHAISTDSNVLAYLDWNDKKILQDIILCEFMGLEEIFCYCC